MYDTPQDSKKDSNACVKRGYKMALLQQTIDTLRQHTLFHYKHPCTLKVLAGT